MTNEELLAKIHQELDYDYQIGFHNIMKKNYINQSRFNKQKYCMNSELVTEDEIVSSILSKGLYVPEPCFGLISTVCFPKKVTAKSFDYTYRDRCNKNYVIVVIIPNYIYIDDKKYFLGDMKDVRNLANFALFYELLPKEFIYGYYTRNVYKKDNGKDEYYFEPQIQFYSNESFYGYMSKEEQTQFWLDYFNKNHIKLSVLNAVNYPNLFNTIFQNKRNRYAIKWTKKTIKNKNKVYTKTK